MQSDVLWVLFFSSASQTAFLVILCCFLAPRGSRFGAPGHTFKHLFFECFLSRKPTPKGPPILEIGVRGAPPLEVIFEAIYLHLDKLFERGLTDGLLRLREPRPDPRRLRRVPAAAAGARI